MSAKNKLEALKSAFDKKAGSRNDEDQSWKLFYKFWKMPEETVSVVRFLPDLDEENNLGFLIENLQHELVINGQKKKVPCLSLHGESCPICDLSRKYYDDKNDEMGKKYYRKKSYIGQVIVIESPIEHDQSQLVKLIEFGPQVFTQIQAAFRSGDLEEAPYEFKGGYNFRFRKTKTGQGQNSYATSNFAPKQTDIEDDVIEQLTLFNLSDYRGKKMDLATIEAMLVADQTGASFDNDEAETNSASTSINQFTKDDAAPAESLKEDGDTPVAKSNENAPASTSSKASSVLDQLRARAKAQKVSAE